MCSDATKHDRERVSCVSRELLMILWERGQRSGDHLPPWSADSEDHPELNAAVRFRNQVFVDSTYLAVGLSHSKVPGSSDSHVTSLRRPTFRAACARPLPKGSLS
jgi:hypothetical protein